MSIKVFGGHWIGSTRLCVPVVGSPATDYVQTARKKSCISQENGVLFAGSR
jgi:hypothetical protein